MKIKLSIAIITFNEERNIERCILSVKDIADEIVVLDSFSTDNTEQICIKHGVNFIQHAFDGHIQQKNRVLSLTKYDHVLSLDADEAVTKQASKEIRAIKENWQHDGYSFPRLNNYCGTWVKHSGWYPDRKLRLFDKTKGAWTGQNPHDKYEITTNDEVKLTGDLLHYSFYTEQQHLDQIDKFTSIASKALFEKGKPYSAFKKYASAFAIFFSGYIIKLGFLDGKAGWKIASNSCTAKLLKYKRLKQLHHESTSSK
ncbi:glycosyltransferase family 2 protein [Cyclobacteriaceae bacterium]|nr:glycosyltransferase family 2 protein [Cyclobacteriaceae bacterium]